MSLSPHAILETSLYAEDIDIAEQFYGDILGFEVTLRAGNRHVFFKCGEAMLLIFNAKETMQPAVTGIKVPTHGAIGAGHVCFRASHEEIEEWINFFGEKSVEIEMDFHWPNGARSIYIRDPFGNSIEFAEPKLWGFVD